MKISIIAYYLYLFKKKNWRIIRKLGDVLIVKIIISLIKRNIAHFEFKSRGIFFKEKNIYYKTVSIFPNHCCY